MRYCAHDQGDMPENHTKELINLYSIINDDNEIDSDGITLFSGDGAHISLVAVYYVVASFKILCLTLTTICISEVHYA